ncbi:nibrin-like [Anopheles bellator]|uniref:nibrin-like n=1 Tax=Anopheles bellator TaxID=139047 RepID=UPI002647DF4D|nr:nibrin-like [Anopheles bellator]
MWYLTNVKTGYVYYLVHTGKHTVGLACADLVIKDDDSISRIHAVLKPHEDGLNVTDSDSQYGTYVNGNIAKLVHIPKETAIALSPGDTVQFGRGGSVWTVGWTIFRCLISNFELTNELANLMRRTGIRLVSSYSCAVTHLITPTLTVVTTKLLQCLIGQVTIVTPDYLKAAEQSIERGKELPNAIDYKPECTEAYIRSAPNLIEPNPLRRRMFAGKQFIFFCTTLFNQYDDIIKLAGGLCCCAVREKVLKSRCLKPNVIAIKSKPTTEPHLSNYNLFESYIIMNGRRMVPDSEIWLAILYASIDKLCNPDYTFATNAKVCKPYGPAVCKAKLLAHSTEETVANSNIQSVFATIPTIFDMHPASGYDESMYYTASGSTSKPMFRRSVRITRPLRKRLADSEQTADEASSVRTDDGAANVSQESKRPVKNCTASASDSSEKSKSTVIASNEHVPAAAASVVTIPETPPSIVDGSDQASSQGLSENNQQMDTRPRNEEPHNGEQFTFNDQV